MVLPKCVFSQASSRGIKNAYSVEQKKKKQEEIEKRIAASGSGGEGGLRVSSKKKQNDATVLMFTEKILFCCHLQDCFNNLKQNQEEGKWNRNGSMCHYHAVFSMRLHSWDTDSKDGRELFPSTCPLLLPQFLHLRCTSLTVLSALGTSLLS